MLEINRYNYCLNIAHGINIALCVWLLIYGIVVKSFKGQNVSNDVTIFLQLVYLVIWTSSLFSLFTAFKASNRLLPIKRMFIIHGALLSFYLFFYVTSLVAHYLPKWRTECNLNCRYICYGMVDILCTLTSAIEIITFVFVVYSQTSLTVAQKSQS